MAHLTIGYCYNCEEDQSYVNGSCTGCRAREWEKANDLKKQRKIDLLKQWREKTLEERVSFLEDQLAHREVGL